MPERKYHHRDLKNTLIEAGVEILAEEGISKIITIKIIT